MPTVLPKIWPKAWLALAGCSLALCAACAIEPIGPGPAPGPGYGYYGYGPDYPWAYGTSVNIYGGGGYRGYRGGGRGGGFHGGGGHVGGTHGGGGGHR